MTLETIFEGISAVATAGALLAAVAAAVQARALYRIESSRDDRARQAEDRKQAARISAWAAVQLKTGGRQVHGVIVSNSSDDPVYDFQAACHGFTTVSIPALACVPPGQYFVPNEVGRADDAPAPGWSHARPVNEISSDPVRPFTVSDARGVDELYFRDSAGVLWRREASGELQRS